VAEAVGDEVATGAPDIEKWSGHSSPFRIQGVDKFTTDTAYKKLKVDQVSWAINHS
jgi:hypothetical protein